VTDTLTTTRKHGVHKLIFPRMFLDIDVYVQKHFSKNNFLCAPCFLVCARLTTCVRTRTS